MKKKKRWKSSWSCGRCFMVIWLCLPDKRVYDNFIQRHKIHSSVIYIQSSLLRVHKPELLHIARYSSFIPSHLHVWLKAETFGTRGRQARLTISHPLHLHPFLPPSTLITCFIFLWLPFLQSDILAAIYLSFQISHKSFYLPLSFQLFFFPS